MTASSNHITKLRRELGVIDAILMGLGSIIGTGVFTSLALSTDLTGPSILLCITFAAGLAFCNGINSAQLASIHPVSGGTYEYGYRWTNGYLGFSAGWMFLLAKSASAATAALGFASYLMRFLTLAPNGSIQIGIAISISIALTIVVLAGLKVSRVLNYVIVSVAILSIFLFVGIGLLSAPAEQSGDFTNPSFLFPAGASGFFQATALVFVAFTGYGRIATLGEEVTEPRKTIPKAIVMTLLFTMVLYLLVALVCVISGHLSFSEESSSHSGSPLHTVALSFNQPFACLAVDIGAMFAMLSVLLNLILGISRVVLAMGRRNDLPQKLAIINSKTSSPTNAVLFSVALIIVLTLAGSIKTSWSISAFSVLIYYSITNICALNLTREERFFPKWLAYIGLFSCLFLCYWVERPIWIFGFSVLAIGLVWKAFWNRRSMSNTQITRES